MTSIIIQQIHWNRGWGAGGSLGKRSPNLRYLLPKLPGDLSRATVNDPRFPDHYINMLKDYRALYRQSPEDSLGRGQENSALLSFKLSPDSKEILNSGDAGDGLCGVDTRAVSMAVTKFIEVRIFFVAKVRGKTFTCINFNIVTNCC